VEVPTFSKETPQEKEEHQQLRNLLEDAVIFYRRHLMANAEILNYLRNKRGLTDASIETFGLGFAPRSWDAALTYFTQRGYKERDLLDVGLVSQRESGGFYDRFRNRIMIPIRDATRRMTGFGARIVDPDDVPKFLNSPETVLFSKGRLLYGLDRAHKAIRSTDQAVIVEGYLDVIALHQAGYENVVSPMGTALTEDQMRLLKKFTRRIILALDPDTAGQRAILRGLDVARAAMDRTGELDFDARGLLRNEARLQADLRVVALPDNLDPDEIVARNRDEWANLIENAKPIVTHVMETLAAGQNLNDPKVKNQIAAQVLPLIEDLPNPLERDTYRQQLARMLKVDERALVSAQPEVPRSKRTSKPIQSPQSQVVTPQKIAVTVSSSKMVEEYIVGVLFRRPELLYRLDRLLQQYGLVSLTAEDFEYTDHQMMFRLIRESVEQDNAEHHDFVINSIPESLQGLSRDLIAQTEKMERLDEKLLEELLRGVIKMRKVAAGENINQLRFLQEEAYQSGDWRASSYHELVLQNTKLLRDLDQASRKMSLKRLE
jgi:DNA primase